MKLSLAALAFALALPLPAAAQAPVWTEPPALPGGRLLVAAGAGDSLYALTYQQYGVSYPTASRFYRYSISMQAWEALPHFPEVIYYFGSPYEVKMTSIPGTDGIYLAAGSKLWRFEGNWTEVAGLPAPVTSATTLAATRDHVYAFGLATSEPEGGTGLYEYAAATGWRRVALRTDVWSYKPSYLCWPGQGNFVYLLSAGDPTIFAAYEIGEGWTDLAAPKSPSYQANASALLAGPAGTLLWLEQDGMTDRVHRYTFAGNGPGGTWSAVGELEEQWSTRATICPAGGDQLYLIGDTTRRFSLATGGIVPGFPSLPEPLGPGATLLAVGAEMYAIAGGGSTTVYALGPGQAPAWQPVAMMPGTVGEGAGMYWTGGNFVYIFPGGGSNGLWRLDRSKANDEEWRWDSDPFNIGYMNTSWPEQGLAQGGGVLYIPAEATAYVAAGGTPRFWSAANREAQWLEVVTFEFNPAPDAPGEITGGIAWAGADLIYAAGRDAETGRMTALWAYSRSAGLWNGAEVGAPEDPADCPDEIIAPIVADSSNGLIYALCRRPDWTSALRAYDIASREWLDLPAPPGSVSQGGVLALDSATGRLYTGARGSANIWVYSAGGRSPGTPRQMGLRRLDTGAPLDPRVTSVDRDGFILSATLEDPDAGSLLKVIVEIAPNGDEFGGDSGRRGSGNAVGNGGTSDVRFDGLATGIWRSRARTLDEHGRLSPWTAGPMVELATNDRAPETGAAQQRIGGTGQALLRQARILDPGRIRIEAAFVDAGDRGWVEFQVRRSSGSYPAAVIASALVDSGATVGVDIEPGYGSWTWRCRAVDRFGVASAWAEYETAGPAFVLLAPGSVGHPGCSGSAPASATAPWAILALVLVSRFRRPLPGHH